MDILTALLPPDQEALDAKIAVSLLPAIDSKSITNKAASLRQIAERIRNTAKPTKGALPVLKLGRFDGGIEGENITAFSGVMGDYDAGKVNPADAAERMRAAGLGCVIYTTASNTPSAPRWRVLVPSTVEMDTTGLRDATDRVNGALGGILGSESWNPAQRYYYGGVTGKPIAVIEVDGKPIDALPDLPRIGKPVKAAKPERAAADREPCPYPYDTCLSALNAIDPNAYLATDRGAHYEHLRNTLWGFIDATGGGETAKKDAFRWREGVEGVDRHERAKFDRIWKSDRRKDGGVTWKTHFHLAREAGWSEADAMEFDELDPIDYGDLSAVLGNLLGTTADRSEADPYAAQLEWAHEIQPVLRSTYIIEDRLAPNGLSVCYGAPNAGKTFFLLQMAFHLARGADWYGRRVKRAAVLYLALEGGNMIANRVAALAREAGENVPFALRRGGFDLLKPGGDVKNIVGLHNALMKQAGEMPSLIVIDTLSRAIAGGDENSPTDMTAFIRNVDRIRDMTGAHLMIVHHTGKDEARGMRGHSALLGAIDSEIHVIADSAGRSGVFGKQRDYPEDRRPLSFELRSVTLGENEEGKEIATAIADPAELSMPSAKDKLPMSAKAAFDILDRAGGEMDEAEWMEAAIDNRAISAAEDKKARQKQFNRAKKRLIDVGLVDCGDGVCCIFRPDDMSDAFDDLD